MKNLIILLALGAFGVPLANQTTLPISAPEDGSANFSIACWTQTVDNRIAVVCANDGQNFMYVDPPKTVDQEN